MRHCIKRFACIVLLYVLTCVLAPSFLTRLHICRFAKQLQTLCSLCSALLVGDRLTNPDFYLWRPMPSLIMGAVRTLLENTAWAAYPTVRRRSSAPLSLSGPVSLGFSVSVRENSRLFQSFPKNLEYSGNIPGNIPGRRKFPVFANATW